MLGYVFTGYVFNWGRCYLHRELDGCPSHASAVAHVRGLTYSLSCHLAERKLQTLVAAGPAEILPDLPALLEAVRIPDGEDEGQ